MSRSILKAVLAAGSLALAATANAQTYVSDPGTPSYVPGPVVDYMRVDQLTGVTLTAYWGNTSSGPLTFGQQGGNWGFFGSGLSFFTGNGSSDTFFTTWSLDNLTSGLTRLVFEAANTNTAFDRAWGFLGLAEGTPGSNIGNDMDVYRCTLIVVCQDRWNTVVTYRNEIGVTPNAPVGDLFSQMDVTFGTAIGTGRGIEANFIFDTDWVNKSGAGVVTPDPSTYALMTAGLVGLFGVARRRRQNG